MIRRTLGRRRRAFSGAALRSHLTGDASIEQILRELWLMWWLLLWLLLQLLLCVRTRSFLVPRQQYGAVSDVMRYSRRAHPLSDAHIDHHRPPRDLLLIFPLGIFITIGCEREIIFPEYGVDPVVPHIVPKGGGVLPVIIVDGVLLVRALVVIFAIIVGEEDVIDIDVFFLAGGGDISIVVGIRIRMMM